jgi:hypothetical protein
MQYLALITTALGAWFVAKLGGVLSASHVHLEGNNREVVAAMRRSGHCDSRFGHLIEDAKLRIQGLSKVGIHLVCKDTNAAAICLANLASTQCLDYVWMGDCPPMIWNVLFAKNVSLY